jgi:hypothetical protein
MTSKTHRALTLSERPASSRSRRSLAPDTAARLQVAPTAAKCREREDVVLMRDAAASGAPRNRVERSPLPARVAQSARLGRVERGREVSVEVDEAAREERQEQDRPRGVVVVRRVQGPPPGRRHGERDAPPGEPAQDCRLPSGVRPLAAWVVPPVRLLLIVPDPVPRASASRLLRDPVDRWDRDWKVDPDG